jgi:hypothetical protein
MVFLSSTGADVAAVTCAGGVVVAASSAAGWLPSFMPSLLLGAKHHDHDQQDDQPMPNGKSTHVSVLTFYAALEGQRVRIIVILRCLSAASKTYVRLTTAAVFETVRLLSQAFDLAP